MLNLIRAYLYRLHNEKGLLKILLVAAAILLIFFFVLDYFSLSNLAYYPDYKGSFASPTFGLLGPVTGLGIIMTVFICRFFGREFKNGTIRNAVCSGHSRFKIFLASNITGIIISLGFYLILFAYFCLGLMPFNYVVGEGTEVNFTICFFMSLLGYIFVAVTAVSFTFLGGGGFKGMLLYAGLVGICLFISFIALIVDVFTIEQDLNLLGQVQRWLFIYQYEGIFSYSSSIREMDFALLGLTIGESLILMLLTFFGGFYTFYRRDVR